MAKGPTVGLEMLDALEGDARVRDHYRLDAVRGHMLGEHERAADHYRAAAPRTASTPERDYLLKKAAMTRSGGT